MNVTLWMAMSVNGIIARENQSEDFLTSPQWEMFIEMVRASDVIIWGRITHEIFVQSLRREISDVCGMVVTRDTDFAVQEGWSRATSPVEAVELLRSRGFKHALLTGGSKLNESFARANLIDDVVLAVEPVIVGRGIPLVGPGTPDLRLDLAAVELDRSPKLKLRYRVLKSN